MVMVEELALELGQHDCGGVRGAIGGAIVGEM